MSSVSDRKKKVENIALLVLAWLPVAITLTALLFLLGTSFMSPSEASSLWEDGLSAFHILPRAFSLQSWKEILYRTPEYLLHFWNSVWITLPSVVGSVAVSVLTGYGLAFLRFRGKKLLLLGMILLMLLPYQVTLTPNFLALDWLGLLNSRWATILPGIFHPFGMVAMACFMLAVPRETLETAQVDGAGQLRCFFYIALPQVKGGIAVLTLYHFLDAWNTVEPVVALLQDTTLYPFSVALGNFTAAHPGISAACSILFVIPALLLFGMTQEQLAEGIPVRLLYQKQLETANRYMRHKREDEQLQIDQAYYAMLEQKNQALQIYAHDAKNHLAAIQSASADPVVQEYIGQLREELHRYSGNYRSGNHILDVILNKYIVTCEQKEIHLELDMHESNLRFIANTDLVAIFGNLMDNAITAAESSRKKRIQVITTVKNSYHVLIIENSCDTPPISKRGRLLTSKENRELHGLGLKSVEKALNKYQGYLHWEYNGAESLFTATAAVLKKTE